MTDGVTLSPYAVAAPDLAKLGFHCLPVVPPNASHHGGRGKAPGEFSMGLWRGMTKWQNLRDSGPSKFQADLWARFPDANIGVVLGSPIGPDRLIAIDVDTTDADELRDIAGALPSSPMEKRGAKGFTRFFKAAPTIKSTPYDKAAVGDDKPRRLVDLLTGFDCRQTVCPPSIHPEGPVYAWLAGPVAASDLPLFDDDDLQVLEETLATLGWVPKAQRRATTPAAPGTPRLAVADNDRDDIWSETKVAALANMEAWVHDLDVYGLRPARGGYEAVATWRASSTGRAIADRKRNLSIQANGISDFGSGWTGSAIDLVMEAQGLDQAEATSWLRMRLGLTGEFIELQQTPRAVVEAAPTAASQSAFTPSPAPLEAPPEPGMITPRPADATELPDHLTRVPGLLGAITDWIVASAISPQRGLSLGAALTLVGTAAGRKFAGPTDSGTHLYVLGIARTGAGKDHPLSATSTVLEAAGMAAHIGPSQFMSMSAVISCLTREPLTLAAIDEFGSFIARVNDKKSGGHEKAISGVWRSAWGKSFKTLPPMEWAGRTSPPIHSPALSIFGMSTPQEFYASIQGGDIANGFLNRFLTISTNLVPDEVDPTCNAFDVPDPITSQMVGIYNSGGALLGATSHNGRSNAPAITVPWDHEQAKHVFDVFRKALKDREADAAFLARTAEMSVRLATIRAIGINYIHPRITVEDMEWGRDLALWSAECMIADAGDYMAENDYQRDVHGVLRIIRDRPGVSKRDLQQKIKHRLKGPALDAILTALIEGGDITVKLGEKPPSGGHPPKTYYPNVSRSVGGPMSG